MPWHLNKIACSAPPKEPCLIPASTSGNSQPPFPPAAGTLILLGPTGTWASVHRPFPSIHIHKIKIKKKIYTELPLFSFLPFLLCFVLFWQLVGTLFSFHLSPFAQVFPEELKSTQSWLQPIWRPLPWSLLMHPQWLSGCSRLHQGTTDITRTLSDQSTPSGRAAVNLGASTVY